MESKLYSVSEKIRQNKNREILQEPINKLAEKLDNPKEYVNILREIALQEKSIDMNELM
jgi:predicted RNase H-like nuclease (RuvC/YqgF family)